MNQQIVIRRDTVKTIRRRVEPSYTDITHGDNTSSAIYGKLTTNHNEHDNIELVVLETSEAKVETHTDTFNKHIRIIPHTNPNGEMSYLYINSNNDTILNDVLKETKHDFEDMPMQNTFYASDTIKPSDYQFGNMSRANVKYFERHETAPYKISNDDIAQVVYMPLMVLITIGYIHRCLTSGAWSRLGSELKAAWIA